MSMPLSPMVTRNAVQAAVESALPGAPVVAPTMRSHSIRAAIARGLRAAAAATHHARR
jgi:hypothetical protein